MRSRFTPLFAGLLGGLLAALAFVPGVLAVAATTENVHNQDEAWYLRAREPLSELPSGDPTCSLPTGCNAAGNVQRPAAGRQENTLNVGIIAGEPDAQTYFTFDLTALPVTAVVTGGRTVLPVAPGDAGTQRADQALNEGMQACFTVGFVVSAEAGSFNDRPEFDCETSAPLVRVEGTDTLTFSVDLAPFGARWAAGEPNNGITILPSTKAQEERRTFNIAFYTRRHANAKPENVISSTLEYRDDAPAIDTSTSTDSSGFPSTTGSGGFGGFDSGAGGFDSGTSGGFDSGTSGGFDSGFDSGAAIVSEPDVAAAPPDFGDAAAAEGGTSAPPAAVASPGQQEVDATPGMTPAIWLLPVVALALVGAVAYSLTRPVELAPAREGAVSRLVRRRSGSGGLHRSGPRVYSPASRA